MPDTPTPRILALAGSSRDGALSTRLRDAAASVLRAAGADVQALDLRALALPLYDGDLEAASGVPAGARQLRDGVLQADGVLFVTPEYNGFPTPLALNAWDWLSRLPAESQQPSGLAACAGKPLALLSTSPGPWGGMRALGLMRQFLGGTFQMLVLPQQLAVVRAHEAFDDTGALKDARQQQALVQLAAGLIRLLR
jgi:chromate reductase, NAD(P)H dehydrogenase (quinone)